MNRIFLLALAGAALAFGAAPAWDSSGDGLLSGTYNFRQVMYISDGSGNINQELAYFGNISFDGKGGYTLSGSNTLNNTNGTLGIPATGTYSVAASGYGFLSNPLAIGQSVYFLVSNGILIGSSTENPGANSSYNNDLFIAAPSTPTFTNTSFNGTYTIANFEPNLDLSFQLSPTGTGSLGTVTRSGYDLGGDPTSQSAPGVSYTFSSGVCTLNFGLTMVNPTFGGTIYGQEILYMSPDTNFVFGGSPSGYDFFVGVRNASGTPALNNSLYYEIGLDEDGSQFASNQTANIDTYYGVFNAFSGTTIGHERLLYAGRSAEGVTYTTTYPPGSYNGPANVGQLDPSATVQYTVGAGGIRIGFGIGPWLGIEIALPAAPQTPCGSVYIDPTGIVNTGSSAPFTAGISPGEFISLYNGVNTGSSSTPCATVAPFPTTLGNIQVMIDGIAAPIYCVGSGSTPVTVIVPWEVAASPIATIQVVSNNVASNIVTAFVYKTTPGMLTYSPVGGIGFAAAQHVGYTLVTTANPAKPGEEIVVYLSGLGAVFPVNGVPAIDNAITGPNGDNIVADLAVDVAGFGSTSIPYAGLTPTAQGLYQINFQVPATAPNGNDVLAIVGPDSYSSESLLPVAGQTQSAAVAATRRVLPRLTPFAAPKEPIRSGTNQR